MAGETVVPTSLIGRLVHRPQQVWLRKAMFQVHLWVGLLVSLYVILIGLSGSILVFRDELTHFSQAERYRTRAAGPQKIDAAGATAAIKAAYPHRKLTFLYAPRRDEPVFTGYLAEKAATTMVTVDPADGRILGEFKADKTVLSWIGQLHYFLLLGRSPGLLLNGMGAALLLLLTVTGLTLWWPGLRAWKRGFRIDFKKTWKRINYDSHNVTGFWTLAIVSFWAISGVYFTWPQQVTAVVNFFSPVSHKAERITVAPNPNGKQADLRTMTAMAREKNPGKQLAAIRFPMNGRAPLMLYLTGAGANDLINADFAYFEPATGKYLSTQRRSEKKTAGDWVIWSMHPLHFGTSWGLGVKILYFLLGLSLPLLVVTGLLMYWNRYLSKKWARLKQQGRSHAGERKQAGEVMPRPAAAQAREAVSK